MGTIIEGELDDVLGVVNRCFAALQTDCDRISCSIKIDYPERTEWPSSEQGPES
jgi:uncharacterized protein YqgV (UPF0045/DUF77 family)